MKTHHKKIHSIQLIFCMSLVLSIFSSSAFSDTDEKKLQQEFGYYLNDVPREVRSQYLSRAGKSWDSTSYQDRLGFLTGWSVRRETAEKSREVSEERLRQQKEREKQRLEAMRERKKSRKESQEMRAQARKDAKDADRDRIQDKHDKIFESISDLHGKESDGKESNKR